jgi:hypothetical protein
VTVQNARSWEDVHVIRTSRNRAAGLALAGVLSLLTAAPAAAAAPTVESWTVHVERPFVDCDGFGTVGIWDIAHRLTVFYDASGTAIRDQERIDFSGRIVNASSGAWVPDSGSRIFFDTLAPDGSFLTTYMVEVRHSTYLHGAGRTDFQTGESRGLASFQPAHIDALCEALGG